MTTTQGNAPGYILIRDVPANADQFGAHARVACAMVDTMEANPGIQTMGLVGAWGSGKSTILLLVEGEFARRYGHNAPKIFTFDAWLHHGEPVRRAFLEAFFRFCTADSDNRALREAVDHVTGRTTTTETHDRMHISPGGLAIIAAIALAGFGYAQGGKLLRVPAIKAIFSIFPSWLPVLLPAALPVVTVCSVAGYRLAKQHGIGTTALVCIGSILASVAAGLACIGSNCQPDILAPCFVLTATLASAVALMTNLRRERRKPRGKERNDGPWDDDISSLLISRQGQSKTTRTSGATAPTAIEFADVFQQAMNKALAGQKTLVVVIDNLDRLPATEAKEMWSTLRTFFAAPRITGPEPGPHPTVIVPVAEEAVTAMYSTANQSFMDKTFDAIFHLPRPVFTGWQEYLQKQMEQVFNATIPEHDIRTTVHLADARYHGTEDVVTPRAINAFINRLALYWMQYRATGVRFPSVAYYCLHKEAMDASIEKEIVKDHVAIDVFDREWRKSIAAVHFGVSLGDANQVLLAEPLERAIGTGEESDFFQLLKTPGALTVLERIVSQYRTRKPLLQATFIGTIARLRAAKSAGIDIPLHLWQRLVDALPASKPWSQLDEHDVRETLGLFMEVGTPLTSEAIVGLEACVEGIEAKNEVKAMPQAQLWRSVYELDNDSIWAAPRIYVQGNGETYIEVASLLAPAPHVQRRLTTHTPEAVVAALLLDFQDEPHSNHPSAAARLIAVKRTALVASWSNYAAVVARRLTDVGNRMRYMSSKEHFDRLSGLTVAMAVHGRLDDQTRVQVKALFDSGVFANIASSSIRYGAWEVAGQALGMFVGFQRALPDIGGTGPMTDEAWQELATSFGEMVRFASESQEFPPLLISNHASTQVNLDFERLAADATAAFNGTRPLQ